MSTPIFLSHPRPITNIQSGFIKELSHKLIITGFGPLTLGENSYNIEAPLKGIIDLMDETYGLMTVALKRTRIDKGVYSPETKDTKPISDKWLTSPYCQIETAIGYKLDLPVLILRDKDVLEEGVLAKGVTDDYISTNDLSESYDDYLNSREFEDLLKEWEIKVMKQYVKHHKR